MKKGIKTYLISLIICATILTITTILITFLLSSKEAILWLSMLAIIGVVAILVLLLLGLEYGGVKEIAGDEGKDEVKNIAKDRKKKADLTLVGVLAKLVMSLILKELFYSL